jgi:hypothetical protein
MELLIYSLTMWLKTFLLWLSQALFFLLWFGLNFIHALFYFIVFHGLCFMATCKSSWHVYNTCCSMDGCKLECFKMRISLWNFDMLHFFIIIYSDHDEIFLIYIWGATTLNLWPIRVCFCFFGKKTQRFKIKDLSKIPHLWNYLRQFISPVNSIRLIIIKTLIYTPYLKIPHLKLYKF